MRAVDEVTAVDRFLPSCVTHHCERTNLWYHAHKEVKALTRQCPQGVPHTVSLCVAYPPTHHLSKPVHEYKKGHTHNT